MAACGGGGSGSNPNPPPTGPTITGISISPTSISLYANTTQQFTAVVTGTGDFNPDVTWTQTGGVSISSSGLFTAGATAGQETVIATSAADPSFFVSAAITVSYQTVSFGNWYGTLTTDNGVLLLPLDFSLSRTGPSLVGPHAALVILPAGGALACPAIDLSTTTEAKIGTDLQGISSTAINTPGLITGSIDSQNNVSLTYMPASNDEEQPITLTGVLSTDGNTISGTFSKIATGCLGSVTSGNFSFSLYPSPSTAATPYSGFFSLGSQNVSFSLVPASITVGAYEGCSAASYPIIGEQEGRFFHVWEADLTGAGTTPLVTWGIVNDPSGDSLDAFIFAQLSGYGGQSICFEPLSSPLEATLTN